MFAIQRVGSMLLVSLLLAACGAADEPRKPPPPVEDTVFKDTVVTPIEKAKGVEDTVMQQKREVDQAVDQSEH